jgi:putative membrane protein
MWYHDSGWSGGGWLLMALMMVAFWAVVIGLVVWAVRSSGSRHQGPPSPPATSHPDWGARQILDERFARGEINEDEYRQRRGVLETK